MHSRLVLGLAPCMNYYIHEFIQSANLIHEHELQPLVYKLQVHESVCYQLSNL